MPSILNGLTSRTSNNLTERSAAERATLAVGSSGADVTFVQKCLMNAGIDVKGGADGQFGPATRKAVKAFQNREGLAPSGVVDEATRAALERSIPRAEAAAPAAAPQRASDEVVTESRRRRQSVDETARATVERGTASQGAAAARPRSGLFGLFRSREATAGSSSGRVDSAVSVRTPSNPAERASELEGMVRSSGGKWRSGVNELNVVGLRGQDIDGKRHANAFNRWNDTLAFVWKDAGGKMNVREFRATTDPGVGRSGSGLGVDANGDGIKDVGHMQPGQYTYRNGLHRGMSGAARPDFATVSRDVDGDGKISGREAQDRFRARALNIHWAWDNPEEYGGKMLTQDVNSSSEGCQVVAMSRGDFLKHVTPLLDLNSRSDFRYTLIDRTSR
jgi:hypothetical protein